MIFNVINLNKLSGFIVNSYSKAFVEIIKYTNPVVDDGQLKGMVTFTDVQKVPRDERKVVKVSQVMNKKIISLQEEEEAVNAFKLLTVNNIGRIIVKKARRFQV